MTSEPLSEVLSKFSNQLRTLSDSPQLDCQMIACSVLGRSRDWLIAHGDEPIPGPALEQIRMLLTRRLAGEPVAYLTGSRSFWEREFRVTPDTLIPRPETELLVETCLDHFQDTDLSVLDLGTGSGAIAISLAEARPSWRVTATDIHDATLEVAKQNAGDMNNLAFRKSSWFQDISGSFDLVVSNPPYVKTEDPHLADLTFEPTRALDGGPDGLACIREIVENAGDHLTAGGHIMLEHGYDQQEQVVRILENAGFSDVTRFADLNGQPRLVMAGR